MYAHRILILLTNDYNIIQSYRITRLTIIYNNAVAHKQVFNQISLKYMRLLQYSHFHASIKKKLTTYLTYLSLILPSLPALFYISLEIKKLLVYICGTYNL